MAVVSNLANRLRVLWVLLTKRAIWPDLTVMVYTNHYLIREIRGNVSPLKFSAAIPNNSDLPPNFSAAIGSPSDFRRPGIPNWISEPSVSEFLGELVFRLRSGTVVELGCFVGWTSAHFAYALKTAGANGRLWCVDYERPFQEIARENLARLDLDRDVEFLCGGSLDEAILQKLPTAIDVVFIDTSHEYKNTVQEIKTYSRRLRPGGYLILHDSVSHAGVRMAINDVWNQFYTFTFATEDSNGLTIMRRMD